MREKNVRTERSQGARGLQRRGWVWLLVFASLAIPARASALDSAVLRSLILPGTGQAHQGHYTRAAIYAGSAILSGFGIILSQVYYNEAVDKYDAQRGIYASYEESLNNGGVVSIEDMRSTYTTMQSEYDSAEDRLFWRNAFVTAFVATYAINLVDVLISKPFEPDKAPAVSFEVGPESFRVTKAFRF